MAYVNMIGIMPLGKNINANLCQFSEPSPSAISGKIQSKELYAMLFLDFGSSENALVDGPVFWIFYHRIYPIRVNNATEFP